MIGTEIAILGAVFFIGLYCGYTMTCAYLLAKPALDERKNAKIKAYNAVHGNGVQDQNGCNPFDEGCAEELQTCAQFETLVEPPKVSSSLPRVNAPTFMPLPPAIHSDVLLELLIKSKIALKCTNCGGVGFIKNKLNKKCEACDGFGVVLNCDNISIKEDESAALALITSKIVAALRAHVVSGHAVGCMCPHCNSDTARLQAAYWAAELLRAALRNGE